MKRCVIHRLTTQTRISDNRFKGLLYYCQTIDILHSRNRADNERYKSKAASKGEQIEASMCPSLTSIAYIWYKNTCSQQNCCADRTDWPGYKLVID